MSTSKEFRQRAWENLKGKYWQAFVVSLITNIIISVGVSVRNSVSEENLADWGSIILYSAVSLIAILITVFVRNPLTVGYKSYYIKNIDTTPDIGELFSGFQINYGKNALTLFLMDLKILLWTLLFIVPGIIKSYEYAMIPYILADNPDISTKEAFSKSKEMMRGNKLRLFTLQISFIGWYILGLLACCVGMLFVEPYYEAALAEFYDEVQYC